ncbi:MAG TPA: ATP-binding protein, partial [Vicinamibacterales bacterium]|nr:ATP-binding protein [Vicinamibacterales bacterium]
ATAERSVTPPRAIPIEAPSEPAWVRGDALALQQLFLNVLLNALEAVRDGGDVSVAVRPEHGHHVVEVADTGRGLSPEAAAHAFDPLFTTRDDGTGLGLTIAARLTHAHGGTIRIENAVGGGAVATIELPAADLTGAAPPPL